MASLGFHEKLLSHLAAGGRGRDEGGQLRAQRAEARHHGQGEHICSNLFVFLCLCAIMVKVRKHVHICNFLFTCSTTFAIAFATCLLLNNLFCMLKYLIFVILG